MCVNFHTDLEEQLFGQSAMSFLDLLDNAGKAVDDSEHLDKDETGDQWETTECNQRNLEVCYWLYPLI